MQTCKLHLLTVRSIACIAVACAFAAPASAQSIKPSGYFVQGGLWTKGVWSATAGVTWPWAWRTGAFGNEVSGQTEAFISHLDAKSAEGGRRAVTQLALVPMFRMRFDAGRSAWFAEGGIGVSTTDRLFTTPEKSFTTRFNFVDVLGVGHSFGASREQEIGIRLQHISNAGIRVPNPGQNLLLLRYGASF
jgi:lipid A 3-O-deacylase